MTSEGESTCGVNSSVEPYSSNSNASDYSAAKCFYLISSMMKNIIDDGSDNEEIVISNDFLSKAINEIDMCLTCVDKENLFSKNEEIDDINTGFIKVRKQTDNCLLPSLPLHGAILLICILMLLQYLFLDYYKGKCYSSMQGFEGRMEHLLSAKDAYNSYLQTCSRLLIIHKEDQLLLDNMQSVRTYCYMVWYSYCYYILLFDYLPTDCLTAVQAIS